MSTWKPTRGKSNPVVPSARVTAGMDVDLPDIEEYEVSDARPSILTRGASGTGKTTGIIHLLQGGKTVMVAAIENKYQSLLAYKPKILNFSTPVNDSATGVLRRPTATEIFGRINQFTDKLGAGEYREHNGKPIDVISADGLMELGTVIHRHYADNPPTASSTGERNSYALWEDTGRAIVNAVVALKDAASTATKLYGVQPVGIYATVGEETVTDKFGNKSLKLILPGNIAIRALPFQFEAVLRLTVEKDPTTGEPTYIANTTTDSDAGYEAKVPGNVIKPREINWNMNDIYDRLVEWYSNPV